MAQKTVNRSRPPMTFTLSPEAQRQLIDYAEHHGLTRSAAVEMLIRKHCAPAQAEFRATSPATPRSTPSRTTTARTPVPTQEDAVARESDGIVREPAQDEA